MTYLDMTSHGSAEWCRNQAFGELEKAAVAIRDGEYRKADQLHARAHVFALLAQSASSRD